MWRHTIAALLVFAVSCATFQDAGEACDAYVGDEVADVFRAYEAYRDDGFSEGLVGRARGSLERARRASLGSSPVAEIPICPRQHRRQDSWKELHRDIESADALVRELEEARGVRFVEFVAGRPQWVDRTTGKPIPADFAESI